MKNRSSGEVGDSQAARSLDYCMHSGVLVKWTQLIVVRGRDKHCRLKISQLSICEVPDPDNPTVVNGFVVLNITVPCIW